MSVMRLGVAARVLDHAAAVRFGTAAEAAGFDLLGVGDSPMLFGDPYVHLGLIAQATRHLRLMPFVTNVVTRDPHVTASAIVSINEVSGGRATLAVGVGDSGVRNLGLRPATLRDLEKGIHRIRQVLTAEDGADSRRLGHRALDEPIPIFATAEGPRSAAMAARACDGVVFSAGLTEEMLSATGAWLEAGLADRPAERGPVEVWHLARVAIGRTWEEARAAILTAMASIGHHGFHGSFEQKHVPDDIRERLLVLRERYDTTTHAVPGVGANARLVDELELFDFLTDRFAIVGTPDQCARRVVELRRRGIENLVLGIIAPDPAAVVRTWARDVWPRVVNLAADEPSGR